MQPTNLILFPLPVSVICLQMSDGVAIYIKVKDNGTKNQKGKNPNFDLSLSDHRRRCSSLAEEHGWFYCCGFFEVVENDDG